MKKRRSKKMTAEDFNTNLLLFNILLTLEDMKEQERAYWETWKQKKEKELGT